MLALILCTAFKALRRALVAASCLAPIAAFSSGEVAGAAGLLLRLAVGASGGVRLNLVGVGY